MRGVRWLPAVGLLVLAACATNRYVGPTSGRSADAQSAMARALEIALGDVPWERARDLPVTVSVATLTEGFGGRSPEERFLEEAVWQRVRAAGGREGAAGEEGIEIRVLGRSLGVTRTRRDFIPLYYAELVEGVADLEVSFYDPRSDRRPEHSQRRAARVYRRKTYLIYMFGPLVREWEE